MLKLRLITEDGWGWVTIVQLQQGQGPRAEAAKGRGGQARRRPGAKGPLWIRNGTIGQMGEGQRPEGSKQQAATQPLR